jgi:3-methyladenine DNA glycosylase Tag
MNKADKAKIAKDYEDLRLHANQLSNFVYNLIQNEAQHRAALMGPTVRSYDVARQKLSETLKRHGIGEG